MRLRPCCNQLPCVGVGCISSRSTSRRASAGSQASYNAAGGGVVRVSSTRTLGSACGASASPTVRITGATSLAVRRSGTVTRRCPAQGAQTMHRWAVPCRADA